MSSTLELNEDKKPSMDLDTDSAELDNLVLMQQVKNLYESMGSLFFINIIVGVSLVVAFWEFVPSSTLLVWLASLFLMVGIRGIYYYGFRRSFEPSQLHHYKRILVFGSASAGIIWGIAGVIFFVPEQFSYQMFILVSLYSMAGGSVFTLSMYLPAFYAFVPITLMSITVVLISYGENIHLVLAAVTVTFLIAMITFNNKISNNFKTSFRLRYENRNLIEQLTIQKEEADSANKAKSKFLAAASHDLRQPLYAIQLFISVLDELTTEAKARHVLGQVSRSANALNSLLDSLLDISKLDAGSLKTETKDFLLNDIIIKLSFEFDQQAKEKNIIIQWPRSEDVLHSEPVLVEQILRNYLSNAVKFTDSGTIRVSCETNNDAVTVSVTDSGRGIPIDSHSLIFEEFHQLGNPERNHDNGLGLGLSIVKRAAELLGLDISVESTPNAGSTFSVTIDKTIKAAKHVETETIPDETITLNAELLIIVIEDDVIIREATQRLLQIWKCSVLVAADRKEAMSVLAASPRIPDAILADYRLRENDTGIKVIDMINEHYKTIIPSALITGEIDDSLFEMHSPNKLSVFKKPLSPAKLRAFLANIKPLL